MISIQRVHNDHLYSESKQTKSRKFKQRSFRKPKRKDYDAFKTRKPRKQRSDKGENLRCWKQLNTRYVTQGLLEFQEERLEGNINLDLYMNEEMARTSESRRHPRSRSTTPVTRSDIISPYNLKSDEPNLKQENDEEYDLQLNHNLKSEKIEIRLEHLKTKDSYTITIIDQKERVGISELFLKIQETASWSALKIRFEDSGRFVQIDLRSDESISSIVALVLKIETLRKEKEALIAAEEKKSGEAYETEMASAAETGRGQYCAIEGLVDRHAFISHKDDKADPTSVNFKKIMREIRRDLRKNVCLSYNSGSMFIRFDEGNPRFLQAMLTGLKGTPYFNGCFLFDIYLPDDYPVKPLQIKHISRGAQKCHANNGPGGFSPNLHQSSGKVCLSLLGTWSGPGWQANVSNVYQVLSSLLFMVFAAEHPYYMEPSYGGWEGTAQAKTEHDPRVYEYDEEVLFHTAKSTILDVMRTPYEGFEDVIRAHFTVKAPQIEQQMRDVLKDLRFSTSFRERMRPIIEEIKKELEKLGM